MSKNCGKNLSLAHNSFHFYYTAENQGVETMKRLVFISIVFLLLITNVAADSWAPPAPFEIPSNDGARVFRFEPNPDNTYNPDTKCDAALYKIGYSESIYTVKDLRSWAYKNNFYFSYDSMHFAFIPPTDFDIALEFYSNGLLVKTYKIKDLVKDYSKVKHSTSTAHWLDIESVHSQDNTLSLKTCDNQTYIFDITTGNIVNDNKNFDLYITAIIKYVLPVIFIIGVSVGAILLRFQRKRQL